MTAEAASASQASAAQGIDSTPATEAVSTQGPSTGPVPRPGPPFSGRYGGPSSSPVGSYESIGASGYSGSGPGSGPGAGVGYRPPEPYRPSTPSYYSGGGYQPSWGGASIVPPSYPPPVSPPPYSPAPAPAYRPSGPSGGSRPSWTFAVIGILALLLVGVGVFAGVSRSSASSYKDKYNKANTSLSSTTKQLSDANSKLSSAQATASDQSSRIAAFTTCMSDLNTFFTDIGNQVNVPRSVILNIEKDCVPLGLVLP